MNQVLLLLPFLKHPQFLVVHYWHFIVKFLGFYVHWFSLWWWILNVSIVCVCFSSPVYFESILESLNILLFHSCLCNSTYFFFSFLPKYYQVILRRIYYFLCRPLLFWVQVICLLLIISDFPFNFIELFKFQFWLAFQ